jgi:iron complex outermembrane receptor protein
VGSAEQPPGKPRDLTALSLEELMNIEVTSVSKKEQKLSQAAAAVYVITQEDIRRSGATSIAEALRMAPGVQVARMNGSKWAISARGFNGRFANKLLVLIDGRSVYTPLFSGVYWDVQDTLLEDIDRIEVIRGPGATMWGANAVNGVINIITKAASQTQGGLVSAGGGTEERGFGGLRYGGPLGPNSHYRLYAKYSKRNHLWTESGLGAPDEWDALRGGFRMDLNLSRHDSLTLQGDLYRNQEAQRLDLVSLSPPFRRSLRDDYKPAGGNVLGRWRHSWKGSEKIGRASCRERV